MLIPPHQVRGVSSFRTSWNLKNVVRFVVKPVVTDFGPIHNRVMGPEGSIAKLVWSEAEQHVAEVASQVLGPDALSGRWGRDRVYSRALIIAGGTTQVNKNILAQRILGLPRDR